MALLNPGYWQSTYWSSSYWIVGYWVKCKSKFRNLVTLAGRSVGAADSMPFPWTFPIWFSDMAPRTTNAFTGRGLGDIKVRDLKDKGATRTVNE